MQMIKRGYRAYNKLRVDKGQAPLRWWIIKNPFQNSINQDLKQQLKSINAIANRESICNEESHHLKRGIKTNLVSFLSPNSGK